MPRLRRRRDAVCAAHGDRCRLGGGDSYVSVFCHEPPPPPCALHGTWCRLGGGRHTPPRAYECFPGTVELSDQEQALRASVRRAKAIQRAGAEGISTEEALARIAAEEQAEAARWESLSCRQVDSELTVRWQGHRTLREAEAAREAELVAEIRVVVERRAVEQTARIGAADVEATEADAGSDGSTPDLPNRRVPPSEPPSPRVTPTPRDDGEKAPVRRRRRRRGPSLTIIDTLPDFDDGQPFWE